MWSSEAKQVKPPITVPLWPSHLVNDHFCWWSQIARRMACAGKWAAAVTEIKLYSKQGRPVLVGTTSVERSEALAAMLKQEGEEPTPPLGILPCDINHVRCVFAVAVEKPNDVSALGALSSTEGACNYLLYILPYERACKVA